MKRLLTYTALLLAPVVAYPITILMDFGGPGATTAGNWNNVVVGTTSIADMIDNTGTNTGITLSVTDALANDNTNGNTSGAGSLGNLGEVTALSDSLYGSTADPLGQFTFSGLSSSMTYSFRIFASRDSVADNRETQYTFTGSTSESIFLNPSSNSTTTVSSSALSGNGSNTITLDVSAGSNNANASQFFYLGAIEITATPVPEPSTYAAIFGASALAFTMYRRRKRIG